MHQSSPIAGRWLARGLAVTIFLYWLLLLALWSDSQHSDVSVAISSATTLEQPLQLVRNDVIIGEGSISVNSSQLNTSSVSSKTMLKTFLDSDGPSTLGVPQFSCLGWRQTGGCSPDGPREPDNDANCGKNIKAGASGYCLLKNEATGEEVQAMRVNCSTMREEVRFNCRQAADFARVAPQIDMLIAAKRHEEQEQQQEVQLEPTRGVLMVMYPSLLSSVYSTVRLLRLYNCSLPVELWYLQSEMGVNPMNGSKILQSLVDEYGPISLRGISEAEVDGFNTKVVALANSNLDQSFVFPENLASVNANAAERYEYMTTNFHVRIFGGGIFRNFPMCYGDNKMKSEHFKTTPWGELPFGDLEDQLHDFTQEAGALEKSSEIQ
uniref:Uncharacterized protein n=1 Tax=Phytophthora fragariae TaxID=53985 RepID=A0A6A3EV11_9STRA|nr:hypothetical protein PF009_g12860 [Phytophthora fragariae]